MPLEGFLCEVTAEPTSVPECVACSLAPDPAPKGRRCHFTAAALEAIAENNAPGRRVSAGGISATGLTTCLRKTYLTAREPYFDFPRRLWPATRGNMFHTVFGASEAPGVVREQRLRRTDFGVTWTGQADEIYPTRRLIVDYKSVERVPEEPKEEHVVQLNLYRHLVSQPGSERVWYEGDEIRVALWEPVEIDSLGIVYITMSGLRKVPVPLWDVEGLLRERLSTLSTAFSGGPPPPAEYKPQTDRFCQEYCAVRWRCLELEGDAR